MLINCERWRFEIRKFVGAGAGPQTLLELLIHVLIAFFVLKKQWLLQRDTSTNDLPKT